MAMGHKDPSFASRTELDDLPGPPAGAPAASRRASFLFCFPLFLAVWVLLSGRFDAFHLGLGVISCAGVAWFSGNLLFPSQIPAARLAALAVRFPLYTVWLLYQIVMANLWVLYLVFHPRMMEKIDPHLMRFKSRLKSDLSLVTFANSITLTPGTITVRVSRDGDFIVHAIDRFSAQPLPGEMEKRIAAVFDETLAEEEET